LASRKHLVSIIYIMMLVQEHLDSIINITYKKQQNISFTIPM